MQNNQYIYMNWFLKFAQYQDFNLTSLENLLTIEGEHPQQQDLFQYENQDTIRSRNIKRKTNPEVRTKTQRIIELIRNLFSEIANINFEIDVKYDIQTKKPYDIFYPELITPRNDDEEVIQEAKEIAQQLTSNREWQKGEFQNFMVFLNGKNKLTNLLEEFFSSTKYGIKDSNLQEIYDNVKNYYYLFENAGVKLSIPFMEFDQVFKNSDPMNYHKELIEILSKITEEIFIIIDDNEKINFFNKNKNLPDNPFVPWISRKNLKEVANTYYDDDYTDWYIEENEYELLEHASEIVFESRQQYASDLAAEYHHQFHDLSLLIDKEPINDQDPRKDMSIIEISQFIQELYKDFKYTCTKNFIDSYNSINTILTAIQKIGLDPNISDIFNNKFSEIDANLDEFNKYYTELKITNDINILKQLPPETLDLNIEEIEKQIEEQEAFKHKMLKPSTESVQDINKLKEIGIKNPFSHDYYINQSKFPGAGAMKLPPNFVEFTISIAPSKSEIPKLQELLEDLNLHSTEKPNDQNPLGWIGGYAEYTTKTIYVTEIQSDVMQRTKYMVNPEIQKQKLNQEINKTQTELNKYNKHQNTKQPKQIIQEQINRINNEQSLLNPNSTQYNKNLILLNKLQQNLNAAPESPNPKTIHHKIKKLTRRLSDLNSQLSKIDSDRSLYDGRRIKPEKYHEQKSIIEKTFKDWIPIFFNTVIREAKKRNFLYLKLISAQELMKAWHYGGAEKEILFKRIYDNTAQLHNGTQIKDQNKLWWNIPLESAKFANWLYNSKISTPFQP